MPRVPFADFFLSEYVVRKGHELYDLLLRTVTLVIENLLCVKMFIYLFNFFFSKVHAMDF